MTRCAATLLLALSLPATAQVMSAQPLTITRLPAAATLVPAQPESSAQQLTPEQREWLAEQMQRNADFNPDRLGAAARQKFPALSDASLEYLIQVATRLASGDQREQQRQLQAQQEALEARKRASGPSTAPLSPSLRAWMSSRARALVDSGDAPDPARIAEDVRIRLAGQGASDGDIMAIAFLVMMEASKEAKEDLREMMDQARAANERKAQQRQAAQAGQATVACVKPPCLYQAPKDSMSEMGELESLRLQMAMDRRSKFIEALSNVLKKQSDTASTITSNLK